MAKNENKEKNVTTPTEEKATSAGTAKTDMLKKHVQAIIQQKLGVKVSKEKAWELFKAMVHGTVELCLNLDDNSISLSGVGTFEILKTKPRGSKAGLDKDGKPIEGAEAWDFVPRFRFFPSTAINNLLEQHYGLADHGVVPKHYGLFATDVDAEETGEGGEDQGDAGEAAESEGAPELLDEPDEI